MITKVKKYLPAFSILVYGIIILTLVLTTPMSVSESNLYYSQVQTPTVLLMHLGDRLFDFDFGFRGLFLLVTFLSGWLFYVMSSHFFRNRNDRLMSLFIYLMLPGTIAESVLVSDAILISLFISMFVIGYLKHIDLLMIVSLGAIGFVHWSSLGFYVIIVIYACLVKEYRVAGYSLVAMAVFFALGGNLPVLTHHGSMIKLLTIYATVFSPLFFIYFFFAGYRALLVGDRDIVWAVSFMSLVLSFLMSVYTKIRVEDFSPYLMTGVIVALRAYYRSSRVRLKKYRRGYEVTFTVVITMLVLSSMVIVLHQPIYRILGKDIVTAVSPMYKPYDESKVILSEGGDCVNNPSHRAINQFRYYGISRCQ